MKKTRYIHDILTALLIAGWGCFLAACSQDSDDPGLADANVLRLSSCTRTESPAFVDGHILKLFLATKTAVESTGSNKYNGTTWINEDRQSATVKDMKQYWLYGAMTFGGNLGNMTIASDDYSQGATLTMKGLEPMVEDGKDPCVVVGVKSSASLDEAVPDDILDSERSFGYIGKPKDQNFVHLLFDHLYGSVTFLFTIDANYAQLRTIKLKSLTLRTTQAKQLDLDVSIDATKTEGSPIGAIVPTVTTTAATATSLNLFTNDSGKDITTIVANDIKTACFLPDYSSGMSIECVYDVYDKANGTPQNLGERTAVNTLSAPLFSVQRGDKLTLTLNVAPTYIYQLSDADLDNPTIKIN